MFRISPLGKGLAITLVSLLIAGTAVVALIIGFHAIGCVNVELADRNGVAARDGRANITDAQAFRVLLHALAVPGATPRQKLHAYDAYVTEQTQYVRILTVDQNYRNAHPLGSC